MVNASEAIALGRAARKENSLAAARAHYEAAAEIYREANDRLAYAHTIRHIADMYLDESDFAKARPLYEESLELYRGSLNTRPLDLANAVRPSALLNEGLGDFVLARELWQEARNLYASLRIEDGMRECDAHLEKLPKA